MRKSKVEITKIDNLMFACMRKCSFNQEESIALFNKAAKKLGMTYSRAGRYKVYDRVANKIDITAGFQQNINQFFDGLTKLSNKTIARALNADAEDMDYALDGALRVLALQKEALNLQQGKAGDQNLFMQFVQQNSNNNLEIDVNEQLASIQEGLGDFGGLIERFRKPQEDSGAGTILTIPAKSEAKNPRK